MTELKLNLIIPQIHFPYNCMKEHFDKQEKIENSKEIESSSQTRI